jgi:hypothetical protein
MKRKEPITKEDIGNIDHDASFHGNDFSLGGDDDETVADNCG